ncbi:hypothetical protein WJX72_011388 [[Myrmecia] bisecta]|uniref:Calcineurin-like phosphoesterase domain-containing protein n=1 Tax=[Myrmecia] bisecta TaxID=41462 RepID=A0AAW1PKZ8_9CHLO
MSAPWVGCTPFGNLLPQEVHKVLTNDSLHQGRIIVVGDVHGCCDELEQLLKQCRFRQGLDNLVLAGDLVNKGPKSREVIETARRLGAHSVRGNHDDRALAVLQARKRGDQSDVKAFDSKWDWLDALTPEDEDYLQQLPFTLSIPSHRVAVVHAGLVPSRPLPEQRLSDMYKMRDVIPASTSGNPVDGWEASDKRGLAGGQPWGSAWKGPDHVFFGHDAKRGLQHHPHATGLDTGCCYGRQLTGAILPPASTTPLRPQEPGACLSASGDREGQSSVASGTPTREHLGIKLLSVPAAQVYEQPKEPKPA